MDFNLTSVALRGRGPNCVELAEDQSITITADIVKHNNDEKNTTISLQNDPKKIEMISDAIEIISNLAPTSGESQSIVFGEKLVEILRWMIEQLMTHSHPPNAPPINTFFNEARNYSSNMEDLILNKNVRTK